MVYGRVADTGERLGPRGLFASTDPLRDVTDHYAVELEWADGFRASFMQSWVAPADDSFTGSTLRVMGEDGGLDFVSGSLTFRDRARPRQTIQPGPQADTRTALEAFLAAVRSEAGRAPDFTRRRSGCHRDWPAGAQGR